MMINQPTPAIQTFPVRHLLKRVTPTRDLKLKLKQVALPAKLENESNYQIKVPNSKQEQ